jgi:hypothetical protein
MNPLSKKAVYLGYVKYALLPWAILGLARYFYYYGFRYVSLSITTDEPFIVESIMQFVVFSGLYALRFARSK